MNNVKKHAARVRHFGKILSLGLIVSLCGSTGAFAEIGVTGNKIVIGGVMDLEGRSRGLGQGMRDGIMAALKGQQVKGRRIEYVTLNDSYNPTKTVAATQELVERGIFAMLGNVGTPTAKVSLPVLADSGVPAVGFFTGAGLLRPGKGDIVNYRASYVQETAAVISAALESGLTVGEICAYVQNDAYGMAGIAGVKAALSSAGGSQELVGKLDEIMALGGDNPFRNNVGPVGVYKRNTFTSREGYNSLKAWEAQTGTNCRLVVTVGAYASIANFIGYAALKGEDWVYSAVSFTGAENLKNALSEFGVDDKIIVTQVVPPLTSNLQIVKDARKALGSRLNYVNLEGYVVGRFILEALKKIPGKEITRSSLLATISGNKFNIGGLVLDYSNDNQGSDLVIETYLENDRFNIVGNGDMARLFR
ncbi:MAG: ABC-type branched-chain amino acid transport systems, periplasmic component [Olavius algarvensis Gamma 3 endosymbiont]|nr:MAG: ABC-type branched-chain amino acid transport systems, periplasmic component [Olavius algarvensis Gamma 3 endosymbiont]